jgi:hypothetical protein
MEGEITDWTLIEQEVVNLALILWSDEYLRVEISGEFELKFKWFAVFLYSPS